MAKVTEAIALGIGPQTDQATVNTSVRDATNLITTVAAGTDATGILLRSPEDLSMNFERIESDGGVVPGSLSRLSGSLSRVTPAVSFTIDAQGNGDAVSSPSGGEFTFTEYFREILEGAQLGEETETASTTTYVFDNTVVPYKTLKIWRGQGAVAESWVLVGCTFNLTWNLTAGEKATITVDVVADSVIYLPIGDALETFPTNDAATAYGNQTLSAPILQSALSTRGGTARGFQSGSIAISYDEIDTPDCNATDGIIKSQGTRSVDVSLGYFADDGQKDFNELLDEGDPTTGFTDIAFTIGTAWATDGDLAKAMKFTIPNLRATATDKIDGGQVLRTITGYAAISGSNSPGDGADEEMGLAAV